jgi:glycosyltransferase involved in cell wall biosynthesis
MNKSNTVLFISHAGCRTGAPLLLLRLIRWLKENSELEIKVLLLNDGELREEFEALADTRVYKGESRFSLNFLCHRLKHKLLGSSGNNGFKRWLTRQYKQGDINLIYSNTICNGYVLSLLSYLKCPVITHVHELESYIKYYGQQNLDQVCKHTSLFIAVSNAVRENLIKQHCINPKRIEVVYNFMDFDLNTHLPPQKRNVKSDYQFTIGACGTVYKRKGSDLFIGLARHFSNLYPEINVRFVWVGAFYDQTEEFFINHDILQSGLNEKVQFIGQTAQPMDFFEQFDAFALTSREEPFGLVVIEAGSLGIPVVCFRGSGGAPEIVGEEDGACVDYLDIPAMAKKLAQWATHPDERILVSKRLQQKVLNTYDTKFQAPKILSIIRESFP